MIKLNGRERHDRNALRRRIVTPVFSMGFNFCTVARAGNIDSTDIFI